MSAAALRTDAAVGVASTRQSSVTSSQAPAATLCCSSSACSTGEVHCRALQCPALPGWRHQGSGKLLRRDMLALS